MRVVVTGATGNVGTSVVGALAAEPGVDEVVGLATRLPELEVPGVEWRAVDLLRSDLARELRGADAVVHLAWRIQPNRDVERLRAANVDGSRRVLRAVVEAGVASLVHASSVAAYSPGPKDRRVDESWPVDGVPESFYARHKSAVEHMLRGFEAECPDVRVVRLRKALVFKREAASEITRSFFTPLLPREVVRPGFVPALPRHERMLFQAVHTEDAADAYRRAVLSDARGAFNIAAEPVLDLRHVADLLGARTVPLPAAVLRLGAAASWWVHLQRTSPGWVDLARAAPLMDTGRARRELGWAPELSAVEALAELLEGMREGAGMRTPPLAPRGGPALPPRDPARPIPARPRS